MSEWFTKVGLLKKKCYDFHINEISNRHHLWNDSMDLPHL